MAKKPTPADLYKGELDKLKKVLGDSNVLYKDLVHQAGQLKDLTDKQVASFESNLDIGKQVAENQKDIFKHKIDVLSLQKKIDAEEDKAEKKRLEGIKEVVEHQAEYQDKAQEALDKYNDRTKTMRKGLAMIPGIGGELANIMDKAGEAYKQGLAEGFDKDNPKSIPKGRAGMKAFGASALVVAGIIGKQLLGAIQSTGMSIADAFSRPEFLLFGAEANAIANEFGNMDSSSVLLAGSMKKTAILTGVTAENQAKIMGMMAATSDASLDVLHSQMMAYQKAGVPFKAIMDDVAGNTELFAKFAKDGGANVFEAAQRAKELGVNLSDVASITDSLLDFENSIEKQMEAQVLLGKNINLDRARQLAFAGDQAGMMDEIVGQMGGEAEFNKLNVIQRKALADSVGLSVERMGALVRAEELGNEAAQKKFMSFVGIGSAVLGILGAIMAAIPGLGLKQLGQMAIGGVKGAAIGAGVGTAAYGVATAAPSFQTGEGEGKMVATTGVGLLHQGETVGRFNMDRTNELLERLVGETRNLGVSA